MNRKQPRFPYLKTNTKFKQFGVQCEINKSNPDISEADIFLNDEIREIYMKAVRFINKVHTHMNNVLNQKCIQGGEDKDVLFRMPEIQNYLPLYKFFLDNLKEDSKIQENNDKCFKDLVEKLSNTSIIEFVPEIKQLKEYKELEKKLSTHSKNVQTDFIMKFSNESDKEEQDDCEVEEASLPSTSNLDVNKEDLENCFINIPEKLKELDEANSENRSMMADLIKEQVREQFEDLILKSKKNVQMDTEKTLSRIIISQVNIPGKTSTQFSCLKQSGPVHFKNTFNNVDVDILDDNNSIILDDEEFERLKEKSLKEQKKVYRKVEPVIRKPIFNCPLKLNQKDMPMVNKDILSAIGIFNDQGEIRPDIMEMMEKGKEKNLNNMRNKIFREKRKCNPAQEIFSTALMSTSALSLNSDSSDIKSDSELEMMENEINRRILK
ncbi:unnamed protein product [Brassicogethes aeneus]|uniref:Uncharacterized protein n=1 Tax=Brassicogethes aeneus TaxID=1431903 RepID=A0A9P0BHZ9_BRAAE|nr:unnamed protein product [Brassicogethes aeneus]